MKLKVKDGILEITTNVYQVKTGAIFINWGNTVIKLTKDEAEGIARDIPDFNQDDFIGYYYSDKLEKKL